MAIYDCQWQFMIVNGIIQCSKWTGSARIWEPVRKFSLFLTGLLNQYEGKWVANWLFYLNFTTWTENYKTGYCEHLNRFINGIQPKRLCCIKYIFFDINIGYIICVLIKFCRQCKKNFTIKNMLCYHVMWECRCVMCNLLFIRGFFSNFVLLFACIERF